MARRRRPHHGPRQGDQRAHGHPTLEAAAEAHHQAQGRRGAGPLATSRRWTAATSTPWSPTGATTASRTSCRSASFAGARRSRGFFPELFAAMPDAEHDRHPPGRRRAGLRGRVAPRGHIQRRAVPWASSRPAAASSSRGVDLIELEDGKIVGNTAYYDGASFARQIGMLPPDGSGADRAMKGAVQRGHEGCAALWPSGANGALMRSSSRSRSAWSGGSPPGPSASRRSTRSCSRRSSWSCAAAYADDQALPRSDARPRGRREPRSRARSSGVRLAEEGLRPPRSPRPAPCAGRATASASGTSSIARPAQRRHRCPSCPSCAASIAARPEARGEHAVERRRRAAALDVAEHRRARLEAGALLDLALEPLADPAEPRVAELVLAGRRRPPSCPPAATAPSATTTIEK